MALVPSSITSVHRATHLQLTGTSSTLIATNQVNHQRHFGLYRRPLSKTYSQSASFEFLLPLFIQTTTATALQICAPAAPQQLGDITNNLLVPQLWQLCH